MKVVVLAGGVGGARFILGVQHLLGLGQFASADRASEHEVTAVVNVGDDTWMFGVRICPDLDTCMYTLAGVADTARGWGHRDETWNAKAELASYGVQPDWFGLGDRDLATHLIRSELLRSGLPLSAVTERLSQRWNLGARLLPVTDDRCETFVTLENGTPDNRDETAIHFQEWWVRYRAEPPAVDFVSVGVETATLAPSVASAIETADIVFVAPSNPVVSVGPILGVPGLRDTLRSSRAPVIGYSPIIAGRPLRGMADKCLSIVGVECTSEGVGRFLGARSGSGILDGWLIADGDRADLAGTAVRAIPLLMSEPAITARMVAAGLEMAGIQL